VNFPQTTQAELQPRSALSVSRFYAGLVSFLAFSEYYTRFSAIWQAEYAYFSTIPVINETDGITKTPPDCCLLYIFFFSAEAEFPWTMRHIARRVRRSFLFSLPLASDCLRDHLPDAGSDNLFKLFFVFTNHIG